MSVSVWRSLRTSRLKARRRSNPILIFWNVLVCCNSTVCSNYRSLTNNTTMGDTGPCSNRDMFLNVNVIQCEPAIVNS